VNKTWRLLGTLALLAVLAGRVEWGRLATAVAGLDGRVWPLAVGLFALAQVLSSWRWRMLAGVAGFGGPPARYVAYYFIGMFFNLLLPTSVGGDVVRAWYLANQGDGPPAGKYLAAFLSVFAERLNGVLVLVALACVATVCCPVALPGWLLACVASLGGGTVLGVASLPALRHIPIRNAGWRRLADAAATYRRHPRVLLGVTGLSLVIQVGNMVIVGLIGGALGLPVPALYYGVLVPLVALLALLPVSLNGMGLREAGAVLLLTPLGVDATAAVTLYLVTFAVYTLASLAGAACYLFGRFPRLAAPPAHGGAIDDDVVGGDPDQGRTGQPAAAA
jgi:uncharacterized membrane protein YbhN (UPF0104 family)